MKQCEKKIAPLLNRLVVFTTDQKSFHGFPDPIRCPEGDNRKSIALYYYAHTEGQAKVRSTNYQLRPGEKNKTVPNWIDNKLIWVYTSLKRTLKLNDSFVSSILDLRLKKAAKKADPPDDYGK
jgi:actin-related protein